MSGIGGPGAEFEPDGEGIAEVKRLILAGEWAAAEALLDRLTREAAEAGRPSLAEALQGAGEDLAALAEVLEAHRPPPEPTNLADFARSDFDGDPPARTWLAGSGRSGWLPAGRVAMLTGPGESGKSRLALQLAVAVAGDAGAEARRAIPSDRPAEESAEDRGPVVAVPDPGGVAIIGWEDEGAEAWRRVSWLRSAGLKAAGALGDRLHYLDAAAAEVGPLWGPVDDGSKHISTAADWTEGGRDVLTWLESVPDIRLAILDPLAAAFGSNENDRALVRGFLSGLGAWAARYGVAVLLVHHPSKGEGAGTIYSGSTDWRNGVRALWTLKREKVPGFKNPKAGQVKPEAPALTLEKASYGGGSGTRVWLRSAGDPQSGTGLAWRECTGPKALAEVAASRGLDLPERRKPDKTGKRAGGGQSFTAPGEV